MKRIALTFDDGPGPDTDALVRFLVDENAGATFFLQGEHCEQRPDVVRLMAESAGIEVATHSHTHPDLELLDDEDIRIELERSISVVTELTGRAPTLFRPPRGHRNRRVDRVARELGQSVILWTVNSRDYKEGHSASRQVLGEAQAGDIVLLHDTHRSSVEATRELVPALRNRGFELVTVSELLGTCAPGRVYRGRNGATVRFSRWRRLQVLRVRRRVAMLRHRAG
jgi:peptidoglycan/xylan/chitin deacetylase (PgdA/CDA1 family)